MLKFSTPTARIAETPPGGWPLFVEYLQDELFLFFTLDTEMLWPLYPPVASFKARLPGYRRAFRVISPTLGRPLPDALPFPELQAADSPLGDAPLFEGGLAASLALGLEEAQDGGLVSGVAHAYPLKQRVAVLQRLIDLLPGGTAGASTAKLIQTTALVGATAHALPVWAHVLDPKAPTCLPAGVPMDLRARVLLNATPPCFEPTWPRGAYYAYATQHALDQLGLIDPELDAMLEALRENNGGPGGP